ncbi:acyl-CoA dehydrogenase family protein [Kitasatospora purpeofusca]|uniref:Acyl-CoA dehydrogenase family protein n=1 Tax=Kitasatospora purpeofusca TaxID=67352 RepID=A0ABZ1TT35_9ACTN|nr:acyl-CoA dehydrogenase family protein [Kitasatospora purpeofusca]
MLHQSASALERAVSAGETEGGPMAGATLVGLDHEEAFPEAAFELLNSAGVPGHYVPVAHGGRLHGFDELIRLVRTVAGRDLTVAVAHGKTFLGAASVWVAGTAEQAARLGEEIRRGAVVSWGLTERHHGSDLLAGEVEATRDGDDWLLSGEKWLINNATRGQLVCVLARTDPDGGPRGFSLFLVDKRELPESSYTALPKIRTHGIRGADISGITFHRAAIPGSALVGAVGTGAETVLGALQLTRTVCVGLSLGAADHALRLAARFAGDRRLYGGRLSDLPQVRRVLGEAAAALLVAEATGTVAGRSVNALTDEMSVVSAVAKAFVPALVQDTIAQLAELMGLRGFLTGRHADGAFAKLDRDHRLVSIFDGSTAVNRNALIDQFPRLVRGYRRALGNAPGVAGATTLTAPLPEFRPDRIRLLSASGSSLVQSLPEVVARLARLAGSGAVPERVASLAEELRAVTDTLHEDLAAQPRSPRDVPPVSFDLAERYELCFAGAACLWLWLNNEPVEEHAPAAAWRDGTWLQACLVTLLTRLGVPVDEADRAAHDRLAGQLLDEEPHALLTPMGVDMMMRSTS